MVLLSKSGTQIATVECGFLMDLLLSMEKNHNAPIQGSCVITNLNNALLKANHI